MNYKLVVYIPELALTSTKKAIFDAGGGRLGAYDHCAWQILGEGQFRPLKGSQPHIGQEGKVSVVPEWRLEVLVPAGLIDTVVADMIEAHPYEEPAYDIFECIEVDLEKSN